MCIRLILVVLTIEQLWQIGLSAEVVHLIVVRILTLSLS